MKKRIFLIYALLVGVFVMTACNHSNNTETDDSSAKDAVSVEEAFNIIKENESNSQFVLLDVRTKAEYNEGHLKNATQNDFFAPDFYNWLLNLEKEKRYLIYCRTDNRAQKVFNRLKSAKFKHIQYIKGGFTAWANSGYPVERPEYKKVLDVHIQGDKTQTNSTIKFEFIVTDLDNNPIRKSKLSLQVFLDNSKVESADITMDDAGKGVYNFDAQSKAQGAYRLICTAEKEGYQPCDAYYYFDVASQDVAVSGSYSDIKEDADVTAELAKKFYNRNIYGYKVYDRTQRLIALGDVVNKSSPTLVIFMSPLCTGCMDKAKDLFGYDLKGITVIPVITSVDENLAIGIEQTERLLTNLGLSSIIATSVYDSKDEIWFSRFKFSTTPKFVLINKEGQIKDIVHGSENLQIATLITKIETMFNLSPFMNKAEVLKQLAEFEKGTSLAIKDKETTSLSDLNTLDIIKQKIEFSYQDYEPIIEDFSPNILENSLKLTYHIEYKKDRQYKTKRIEQDFYGFKKEGGGLETEIEEMNNVLKNHGSFDTSNIANITLEEFGSEHVKNDCSNFGYKVVIKRIDKDKAKNEATLHYYIQKKTNEKVRTEDKTYVFSGFRNISDDEKKVIELLKEFEDVSVNEVDVYNTLRFKGNSFAEVSLTVFATGQKVKVKDVLNGKPALIGIGRYSCFWCKNSWRTISDKLKEQQNFTVIELLTELPNKTEFLNYLTTNRLGNIKNHFYNEKDVPVNLRPIIDGVPAFMILDKEGMIKPMPKNLKVAFKMLKSLTK